MANKLIKRRYNKLLSYRNNYFMLGSQMQNDPYRLNGRYSTPAIIDGMGGAQNPNQGYEAPQLPPTKQPGLFGNLGATLKSSFQSGALNGAAGAIGGMAGNAIGGGLSSGAGNVISSIGNLASAIPGPLGAVASAGLQAVGGLVNRMFGSKINEANVAAINAAKDRLNNFKSDASSLDTLSDIWGSTTMGSDFSNDYVGEDGWFSNKAKNKAKELREQMSIANAFAQNTLQNNADNIIETTINNLETNYAALGGFLNQYANGGSIHINPKNKGKFNATKERTGKTTEELTHSKNPLTRKRAIFAQNAKKWHHAFGGDLMTHGANFDTGITLVGNGGTHEENPLEGVPMGMDSEGVPNLVEEGEVIFNDYVFSKRLKVPKEVRKKYKLRGTNSLTFADAAIQMSKESEERPNDPISKAGMIDSMSKLMAVQEQVRERQGERKFAKGGHLYRRGGTKGGSWMQPLDYNNSTPGLTFGQEGFNPYKSDGSIDWDIMYKDDSPFMARRNYVIDNWESDKVKQWLPKYTEAVNKYNKGRKGYVPLTLEGLTKDIFSSRTADKSWGGMHAGIDLAGSPVTRKTGKRMYLTGRTDASGTPLEDLLIPDYDPTTGTYQYVRTGTSSEGDTDYTDVFYKERPAAPASDEGSPDLTDDGGEYPDYDNWMRYMPIVGSSIGLGTSLFTKPDDSDASAILGASSGKGAYIPVRYRPVSNYLTYRPFDRNYYINKMNAEAGASRRHIMNTSGGNRATAMAGILAADNNYLNQLSTLARQAEEYNLAKRNQVEEFNRGTNIQNSQGFLQADIANQEALSKARDFSLRGTMAAADIRAKARLAREQAISDNLSNIFSSFGDIGKEKVDRKWRTWAGKHGVYAPVQKEAAYGGKIKRKKRGLTF